MKTKPYSPFNNNKNNLKILNSKKPTILSGKHWFSAANSLQS